MIIDNPKLEHIAGLRQLWKQAFGDSDEYLDLFFETGFSCDRCFCICLEDRPVAAVYTFDCQWQEKNVAYLYALAVDEQHRGQGLSRLLMSDVHGKLQGAGYAGALLEPASDWLAQYYATMGYRPCGGRQQITACAGGKPEPVQELGVLGYEQNRRALLPDGGVEQTGAVIRLLQRYAALYGGEDFVAAVSRQTPEVLEYLGDRAKLPGFLKALHMEQAQVRLPGPEPTAMYLDFAGNREVPTYFGLPMD